MAKYLSTTSGEITSKYEEKLIDEILDRKNNRKSAFTQNEFAFRTYKNPHSGETVRENPIVKIYEKRNRQLSSGKAYNNAALSNKLIKELSRLKDRSGDPYYNPSEIYRGDLIKVGEVFSGYLGRGISNDFIGDLLEPYQEVKYTRTVSVTKKNIFNIQHLGMMSLYEGDTEFQKIIHSQIDDVFYTLEEEYGITKSEIAERGFSDIVEDFSDSEEEQKDVVSLIQRLLYLGNFIPTGADLKESYVDTETQNISYFRPTNAMVPLFVEPKKFDPRESSLKRAYINYVSDMRANQLLKKGLSKKELLNVSRFKEGWSTNLLKTAAAAVYRKFLVNAAKVSVSVAHVGVKLSGITPSSRTFSIIVGGVNTNFKKPAGLLVHLSDPVTKNLGNRHRGWIDNTISELLCERLFIGSKELNKAKLTVVRDEIAYGFRKITFKYGESYMNQKDRRRKRWEADE